MIAIKLTGLQKNYGQVKALAGLDLEVPAGSIFGFLGPNGAGKTTTLRILAGLAAADSGVVEINGKTVRPFQANREIGYLPEEPAFYPWMTPLETLNYLGSLFGLKGKEARVRSAELLELVGLKESAKRRVGGFSRGMRQRLGLAQALINRPAILLLDEPASALDPMGRKEVLELIDALRKDCTVLMSTHILADAERVCDTVAILYQGKRLLQSAREELMQKYASPLLDLELGNGQTDESDAIAAHLRKLPSLTSVNREGHVLHLSVTDIQKAQSEVMQELLAKQWNFDRLDVVKPTLEEVFVKLVDREGERS
jgi:ABC-2 type transport system ATP-binding protein